MVESLDRTREFRESLAEYLSAAADASLTVDKLELLAGGISRETWRFQAVYEDVAQPSKHVLRRDRAGSSYRNSLERDQEFQLMNAAREAGIAVPRPQWYCVEPCILGAPFLVMEDVPGISQGEMIVQSEAFADARLLLPGQMAEQLARIHALDCTRLHFLPSPRPGYSPAQEAVTQIQSMLVYLGIHNPALVFGLRWVSQNLPRSERVTLVHGDFRIGNLLVGEHGLNAIIDWEAAHVGDPLEDLAWACLRDGRSGRSPGMGGLVSREAFVRAYETASGHSVDRKALHVWEVLGNLRRAVQCLWASCCYKLDRVEMAKLGRHSAEVQFEMLRLLAQEETSAHV